MHENHHIHAGAGQTSESRLPDMPVATDAVPEAVEACAAARAGDRPLWPAIWNGWRRKCPCCGQGPLMKSYLKVRDSCPVCRQELHHHRADDGPAYLAILIVGHIMAPLLHVAFTTFRPEPMVLFTIFAVGTVALSLYLLPRLKGVVVGVQWARRMHGFGRAP